MYRWTKSYYTLLGSNYATGICGIGASQITNQSVPNMPARKQQNILAVPIDLA